MLNSRLLMVAGFALCMAGCGAVPFFSSDATPRNPVPKPDLDQNHDGADPKIEQNAGGEKKRTPSVVWLPENHVRARNIASKQNRITDGAGYPVLTGLSECIRPGYSLLDGADCGADSDSRAEAETVIGAMGNGWNKSSLLNTDLLDGAPQAATEKTLPPAAKMVENSIENEQVLQGMQDRDLRSDRADSPEIVQASATPTSSRLKPARYERIVLSSDLVFEFAKFNLEGLSVAGQDALRGLRDRFAKYDPTSFRKIVITGHADRLGKPKSNVTISLNRASAIKSYLISTGIDPDILEAVGVGSVSPVAHCAGRGKAAKLKSCLTPNRRVEIEIIGAT